MSHFSCLKKKILKFHSFRDYNNINSSKFDILPIKTKDKYGRTMSLSQKHQVKFETPTAFRESTFNSKSNEKEIADNELDEQTTATFFCHKKQFVFTKKSCYLFSNKNKIRYFCVWATESKIFQINVMIIIICHSLLLGLFDYKNEKADTFVNNLVHLTENLFISFYAVEAAMKIIARGFYLEKRSYLRKLINILDFFVLIAGVFKFEEDLKYFGELRLFRLLIVLKKIEYFKSLSKFSRILMRSFWHFLTIIIFLIISLFLFAVIGLNLWKGKLSFLCRTTNIPLAGNWPVDERIGRTCGESYKCGYNLTCGSNFYYSKTSNSYVSGDLYEDLRISEINFGISNFDDLSQSFLTGFQIYMIESWEEIMFILFDSVGKIGPTIYCILLIMICSFFISNMVVAAMVDHFSKESENEKFNTIIKENFNDYSNVINLHMKEKNEKNIGIINLISALFNKMKIFFRTKEKFEKSEKAGLFQKISFLISTNPYFQATINIFIIINIIILSMDGYPSYIDENPALIILNIAFTVIFILESILKLNGLGYQKFMKNKFNQFEALVSFITIIELISNGGSPSRLSSLRAFRIFRLFSYHRNWDGYKVLIDSLAYSVSYVLSFSIILGIYMYVFAVIGMKYFGKFDEEFTNHSQNMKRGNFNNLLWAYASVFQIICLEKWNHLWYKYILLKGPLITHFYFITLILTGRFILFNLFLAALLGLFEQTRTNMQIKRVKALFVLNTIRSSDRSPSSKIRNFYPKNEKIVPKILTKENTINKINNKKTLRLENLKNTSNFGSIRKINSDQNIKIEDINSNKVKYERKNTNKITFKECDQNQEEYLKEKKNSDKEISEEDDIPTSSKNLKENTEEILISPVNFTQKLNKVHPEENSVSQSFSKHFKTTVNFNDENKLMNYFRGSSLFIFYYKSKFRLFITKIINHNLWETTIMCIIIANSIVLALDNPLNDPESLSSSIFKFFDYFFTFCFILEMTFKIISTGLIFNCQDNKKAYLRNYWNILDCSVVVVSVLGVFEKTDSYKSLKSLRAVRALRPLRFISKNDSLRIIVNAIFRTIPSLNNLGLVVMIINLVVSINTMNLWKGQFYSCELPSYSKINLSQIIDINDCISAGGIWSNKRKNFDNILNASLSFFLIVVNENWLELMYSSIDSVGIGKQPITNNSPFIILFYFAMILIGNFIIYNLFVSVVIDNFMQMREELGGYLLLTNEQKEWVEMQKFMQKRKLKVNIMEPKTSYGSFFFKLIQKQSFEIIILILIFANLITLSCKHVTISSDSEQIIDILSYIFLIIFNIEFLMKLAAFRFAYFKDSWNRFDFLTIIIADAEIFLYTFYFSDEEISFVVPLILRSLRLGKIIKYVKISKNFQVILNTFSHIIPSLSNISALIFLIIYIYTILGLNLFSSIEINNYKNGKSQPIPDFTNFFDALLVLIQCATMQQWDYYMLEFAESKPGCIDSPTYKELQIEIKGCGTSWSYLYFLSFIIIVPLMVMNLFLAVVIEGYIESLKEHEAVISPIHMEEFIDKWAEYDPTGSGFLTPQSMAFLLHELHPPIGLKDDSLKFEYDIQAKKNKGYLISPNRKVILTKMQIFNLMKEYNLPIYNENKLHFKDLCVLISKKAIIKSHEKKIIKIKEGNDYDRKHDYLEIKSDYVIKTLNKFWESKFPMLKKQKADAKKNNRGNLKVCDLFAIQSIMTLLKRAKEEKKNRPNVLDYDYRVYDDYQHTNIMDKNLSNKILKSPTSNQNPILKKRMSKFVSPYKSRQTMLNSERVSNSPESPIKNKSEIINKFKIIKIRKTSTLEIMNKGKKLRKNKKKRRSYISKQDNVEFILNKEDKSVNRIEDSKEKDDIEQDQLFWYSYEAEFRKFPMNVREETENLALKQDIEDNNIYKPIDIIKNVIPTDLSNSEKESESLESKSIIEKKENN